MFLTKFDETWQSLTERWPKLTNIENPRRNLTKFEEPDKAFWQSLRPLGKIWQTSTNSLTTFLAKFGKAWQNPTDFDNIWQNLTKFDKRSQNLTKPDKVFGKAFDKVGQHLTNFDEIWWSLTKVDKAWQWWSQRFRGLTLRESNKATFRRPKRAKPTFPGPENTQKQRFRDLISHGYNVFGHKSTQSERIRTFWVGALRN